MLYFLWTIVFGLSCTFTLATNFDPSPGFPNFLRNRELPPEKSLLDSIVKSFQEQSRVYCIVMIYDDIDIDIKSNSLSKFEKHYYVCMLETYAM